MANCGSLSKCHLTLSLIEVQSAKRAFVWRRSLDSDICHSWTHSCRVGFSLAASREGVLLRGAQHRAP